MWLNVGIKRHYKRQAIYAARLLATGVELFHSVVVGFVLFFLHSN